MSEQEIDLKEASVEQLKALAYDEMIKFQTAQNNLIALNKAIEYKQTQAADSGINEPESNPVE